MPNFQNCQHYGSSSKTVKLGETASSAECVIRFWHKLTTKWPVHYDNNWPVHCVLCRPRLSTFQLAPVTSTAHNVSMSTLMLHPKFQIQGHHDIIKINHSLILALVFSAVTKLFKIHICRMQISASKIRQMRMRMSLDKGLFYHSGCNTPVYVN